MEEKNKIERLILHVKDYAEERMKLITLGLNEKVSLIISSSVAFIIFGVLAFFIVLFLSLALAWWVGRMLGAPFLGFLIVGGFYLLIAILAYFNREKWIINPISGIYLKSIYNEDSEHKGTAGTKA